MRSESIADRWERVKSLKREARISEAIKLLEIEAADQETEAVEEDWDVAPAAFQELARLHRRNSDFAAEAAILERLAIGSSRRPDARLDQALKDARKRAEVASLEPQVAACPHCGVVLDPPPARSRRCPECRERIVVRTEKVVNRKLYLTPEGAEAFDAEKAADAERAKIIRRVAKIGYGMADFDRVFADLKSESGADPNAGDVFWRLANSRKVEQETQAEWLGLTSTCREMAQYLHGEGHDSIGMLREAARAELCRAAEDPFTTQVEIISHQPCQACGVDDRKRFTVSVAQAEERLPHLNCDQHLCQCWYRSLPPDGPVEIETEFGTLRIEMLLRNREMNRESESQ